MAHRIQALLIAGICLLAMAGRAGIKHSFSQPVSSAVKYDVRESDRGRSGNTEVLIRTRSYSAIATAGKLTLYPFGGDRTIPHPPVTLQWSNQASIPQIIDSSVRFYSTLSNIDVVYRDANGNLEYDFVVQPGGNPDAIRITVEGSASLRMLESGELLIATSYGSFIKHKPFAYQLLNGKAQQIQASYRLTPTGQISFDLGDFNSSLPLVIDPVITYSTTFGNGTSQSGLYSVAKAPDGTMIYFGNSYTNFGDPLLPGETKPRKFLVSDRYLGAHLTRFRADLGSVLKTVRLGYVNTNYLAPRLLAVGPDGGAVTVQGYTDSNSTWDPPPVTTTGPYGAIAPPAPGSGHLRSAIVKAKADLETLSYSTVIRCTGDLVVQAITIASNDDLVLAGYTTCPDLPISPGAFSQPFSGITPQLFLMRLSGDGKVLKYSTVFSRSAVDAVSDIAIRDDGAYVIAGTTSSKEFPTTAGALRTSASKNEGFVLILSADGSSLVASTLIGGSDNDRIVRMALVPGGDIVVTLVESSRDLAVTPGAFRPTALSGGAVARIAADLSSYRFLSYAPGSLALSDLAVDEAGDVWILTGLDYDPSEAPDALAPPLAEASEGMRALLYKLKSDGTALLFSTPWFGYSPGLFATVKPGGADILVNGNGNYAYPVSGSSFSTGEPGSNINDVYIARLDIANPTRCQVNVPSPDVSLSHRGGSGVFTVLAPAGCPWMAIGDASVLGSPAISGLGNGEIPYTVGVNNSSYSSINRPILVNGIPLFLRQDAADCADWSITPESLDFGAAGGVRTVTMAVPGGCAVWHTPGAPWLTTTLSPTPFGAYGPLTFSATVPANMFAPRATTLKIMGRDLPVTQAGGTCSATITPSQTTLSVNGGIVTLHIATSGSNCSWAASGNPNLIRSFNPANGIGTGDLRVEVSPNGTNRSRSVTLFVAGQTVTLEQDAGSCQVLSHNSWIDVEKGGGPYYGDISAQGPQCAPQPVSEAEWIQPVPPSSVYPDQFGFYALPNWTGTRRRAQVSVLGKNVTVQQFAGPTTKVSMNTSEGLQFVIDGETRPVNGAFLAETGVPFTIEAPAFFVDTYERLQVFNQWTPQSDGRRLTVTPSGEYFSLGLSFDFYFPFRISLQGNPASGGGSVVRIGGPTPFYSTATADYYRGNQPITLTALDGPNARFLRYEGALNSFERTVSVSTYTSQPLTAVFEAVTSPVFALSKPSLAIARSAGGIVSSDSLQISSTSGAAIGLGTPEISCPAPVPAEAILASLSAGVTPTTLSARADAGKLELVSPGAYTCTLQLRATGQPLSISVLLSLTIESSDPGTHQITAVVEGAGFRAIPIAPGSIASIFGTGLADTVARPEALPLPTELGGTRFVFRSGNSSLPAGLFYVSQNQVNILVPDSLPYGSAILELYRGNILTDTREVMVAPGAPSLFTANSDGKGAPSGFAVRVKAESQTRADLYRCEAGPSSCTPTRVDFGDESESLYLELFGTGFRHLASRPTAMIGGQQVDVEYTGPHSQFVGLDQINLKIPRHLLGLGVLELEISVDGLSTNKVQVRF